MSLIKFAPVVTVTALSLFALPAQAFSLAGESSHTSDGLLTELSVVNEVYIPDEDIQFTVLEPSELDIGSLFLEGDLGDFGVTDAGMYDPVSSYITGFEFLGQAAVFNLNAGENVLFSVTGGSTLILDSELSGDIVDLDGTVLGTATGSLSSSQTGEPLGKFSLELDVTPISLDTPDSTPVPDPNLLLGLISLAISACWKGNNKLI